MKPPGGVLKNDASSPERSAVTSLPSTIADAIRAAGGRVTFARFMELALTDPEAGYYTREGLALGPRGDFTTAPHAVPAFNRALARLVAQVVDAMPAGPVLVVEVGAGEGDLAAGMQATWEAERPDLRGRVVYRTVDVGGGLRRRQQQALAEAVHVGWDMAVCADFPVPSAWPPGRAPGCAVVVSNELFDALPVHRIDVGGDEPREAWVRVDEGASAGLREEWGDLSPEAAAEFATIFRTSDTSVVCAVARALTRDGMVELRPAARELLETWVSAYPDICVVTIDYGDRMAGLGGAGRLHGRTLRGYLHHRATGDPYQAVGRQDLTADVDFRALHIHGEEVGLECILFATLGAFLRGMGGVEEAETLSCAATDDLDSDIAATALGALLDDAGLGGEFKIMVQVGERPAARDDRPRMGEDGAT